MSMRVLVFAGSRSQLLQHIPVERTVRSFRAWEPRLVLSSERGDHALWAPLLDDYGVTPCHRLGPAPASLSDASLLAHIMSSASLLLHREAPAAVLVYGHSVTTLAAALAAAEHGIPVIHVGAGQCPEGMSSPEGRHAELTDGIRILPPLTHIAFLSLVCASTFAVTDSPALQREALYAGKRALLLPPVPSGSAAVQNGWHIACTSAADLAAAGETVLQPCPHPGLPGTSGQTSRRVAAAVMAILADIADGIPQGDSASGPQDD